MIVALLKAVDAIERVASAIVAVFMFAIMVIVFSDGLDTSSWLSPAAVLDTARQSRHAREPERAAAIASR